VLEQQESTYSAAGAGIGGGGARTLRFAARSPGTAVITARLYRSWEGDASIIGRFALTVNVRA
jgi:inhibitor of cysteine peptidase